MKPQRLLLIIAVSVLLLGGVGYIGVGVVVANTLMTIGYHCSPESLYYTNIPESFVKWDGTPLPDYAIDKPYSTVEFHPRGDDAIALSGWHLVSNEDKTTPTIIIVHGLGTCKQHAPNLIAADTLLDAGFNVFVLDLREHGASQRIDGRFTAGIEEHLDALGAYDWLVNEYGVPADKVGIMGFSLGAGTSSMAFAKEPQLVALWADSPFANLTLTITYELRRLGIPTFLSGSGIMMAQVLYGVDLSTANSEEAFGTQRNGRPVYLTHGTADERLSVDFTTRLTEITRQTDPSFEPWLVEGLGHVEAIWEVTDEYQSRLVTFFTEAFAS
ncbi:MAG: alpha/beta hydrolase [Phototrophicaceae bacterium]